MELTQYLKNSRMIKFKVLRLEDSRKTNSTLEVGSIYTGTLYPDNCVYFTDINEQQWCFYIGDTCSIIDEAKSV